MSYPWSKFWHKALHDVNILKLTDEEFRFWAWNILVAGEADKHGSVGREMADLAILHHKTEAAVRRLLQSMTKKGFYVVKDGEFFVKKWDVYQASPSDSREAARVRKAKERSRKKRKEATRDVTTPTSS